VALTSYIESLRSKYSREDLNSLPGDHDLRFKIFSPIFANLHENKIVYQERFLALVRLENIDISSEGFEATAVPYRLIERGVPELDSRFPDHKWEFGATWSHMTLAGNSIRAPYANWNAWCDPSLVKAVEELMEEGNTQGALLLTANESLSQIT
jgi:hypothetical protein